MSKERLPKIRPLAPLEAAKPARQALVVAGMHRSGTSAVTRVLNLLGADLPARLSTATDDNPTGFWEPQELVELNDRILISAGSSWHDSSAVVPSWFESAVAARFRDEVVRSLRNNFRESPLFVIKDPRICRLLLFWIEALRRVDAKPLIVIPFRSPLEVAASLHARNGFLHAKSLLLWLRHVLMAELESRGYGRSFVPYEEFVRDWRPWTERIAGDLGIAWPRASHESSVQIDEFLSERHRHQRATPSELADRADVALWVKRAYRALRDHTSGGGGDLSAIFDEVRDELDRADVAFGQLAYAADRHVVALHAEAETLRAEVEAKGEALEALEESTREKGAEIEGLRGNLQAVRARREELESGLEAMGELLECLKSGLLADGRKLRQSRQELLAREARIAELEREIASLEARAAEIPELRDRAAQLEATLAELKGSRSWRYTRLMRGLGGLSRRR